jgi:hypothetical protein
MGSPHRRAYVAAAAVVLCASVAVGAEPPRLDIVWVDPTAMARGSFAGVASESHAVLAAIGADVTWREGGPDTVLGPEALAVIAIPSAPPSSGRGGRHIMGATRTVADGAVAVWVFPDQVAWALGLDLGMRRSWGRIAERNFSRALARVASHEILHALGASGHSRVGLMAPHLDRQALTAASLPVDHATVAIARRSLSGGSLLAATRAWSAAILAGGGPAALTSAASH